MKLSQQSDSHPNLISDDDSEVPKTSSHFLAEHTPQLLSLFSTFLSTTPLEPLILPILQPSLDALSLRVDGVESEYRELTLYYMKRRRERSNMQMDVQGLRERLERVEGSLKGRGEDGQGREGTKMKEMPRTVKIEVEKARGDRVKSGVLSNS